MWKDSETNVDLLDFDYLIEITKDIILNDELSPSSIGIYGDWGCGKSSLMEMIIADLSSNPDILCLKFNGWLFEGYEDAKTALIGTILDNINQKKRLSAKAKGTLKRLYKNVDFFKLASKGVKYGLDFAVTGGLGSLADITLKSIKEKIKEKSNSITAEDINNILSTALNSKEIRNNLKTFQDDFAALLAETKIKRLVVFIDELDRCNHDTILETFEAIRLFLFAKGTSFIIGADERQVMYAVSKKFPEVKGHQIDIGKEYLEKIIQYPVKIPQLGVKEVQFYIMCLLLKHELKKEYEDVMKIILEERQKNFLNFKMSFQLIQGKFPAIEDNLKEVISLSNQLSVVLSKRLNGNPRHCKRFLNSYSMRIKMGKIKKVDLDKKVLAKLMLLEYFKDAIFKEIGDLQSLEKGIPNDIKLIEKNEWNDVKRLKLWKEDSWFQNWIKIEPKLSDIDLQPYYYFSRESLQSQNFSTIQKLSIEAERILEELLSGSDSSRAESIKKAKLVSYYEASEILKVLITNIESASEISIESIKSFIEWGLTNEELYSDVLACLYSLPSNKIKASFIPYISNFSKTTAKTGEIEELYDKWLKENTKLKNAISNEI